MSVISFDQAIVVLGMHRSGTSALTGVLGCLGHALPRKPIPSGPDNERGFWESEAIRDLNEAIFEQLGVTWRGLETIDPGALFAPDFNWAGRRAAEILREEFPDGAVPVIKDPRISRLLPLWVDVLDKTTPRTVFAFSVREPLEVAQSLAARNQMTLDHGLLLWARYYLDAESQTRGKPRGFVDYSALLDDWRGAIERLASATGLNFDASNLPCDEIEAYLSRDLRHHVRRAQEMPVELSSNPILNSVAPILKNWAGGQPERSSDHKILDEARHQLDDTSSLLWRALEAARIERKRQMAARAELDSASADAERAIRSLEDLDHIRRTIEQIEKRQEEGFERLREREKSQQKLNGAIEDLTAEVRRRTLLEEALADATAELMRLGARIDELQADRSSGERELSRLAAEIVELDRTVLNAQSDVQSAKDEIEDLKRKSRARKKELDQLRNRSMAAEAALERYGQSLPWRFYTTFNDAAGRLRRAFGGPREGQKRWRRGLAVLASSPLFDRNWYLETYPDVASARVDPLAHYLEFGWREGRDPSPAFCTNAYLKTNADVAAAGVNPLLHYIEHGQGEGRDAPGQEPLTGIANVAPPTEDFGPPAPCLSVPRRRVMTMWIRSSQFEATADAIVDGSQRVIALVANPAQRRAIEDTLAWLSWLSGVREQAPAAKAIYGKHSDKLKDAWHAGGSLIRTRWKHDPAEDSVVVRAIQNVEGGLTLVGESLVTDETDILDVRVQNPYFPLLFVFTSAQGELLGWDALPFPSLCRGGLHYSELVALGARGHQSDSKSLAPNRTGMRLAQQLQASRRQSVLVGSLAVDLRGADGTHRLFQPEFKTWLSRVFGVSVAAIHASDGPYADYLSAAVHLESLAERRTRGNCLAIASDMVPSISALVATQADGSNEQSVVVPFIVSNKEASQFAVLTPAAGHPVVDILQQPIPFPVLQRVESSGLDSAGAPFFALRQPPSRPLTEQELLVPIAAPHIYITTNQVSSTWIISANDWRDSDLLPAIETLAAQSNTEPCLALIGSVSDDISDVAKHCFRNRLALAPTIGDAVRGIDTAYVGYLGPGVLLHDRRTTAVLAQLLEETAGASASAVIVTVKEHGNRWIVQPTNGGSFRDSKSGELTTLDQSTAFFWRSAWPVGLPPQDLWMTRPDILSQWLRAEPDETRGQHWCSALVTASYVSAPRESSPVGVPACQSSTQIELLVG